MYVNIRARTHTEAEQERACLLRYPLGTWLFQNTRNYRYSRKVDAQRRKMDAGVHAKENHGDNPRPAPRQRPSRRPLGEIQTNALPTEQATSEDAKNSPCKSDPSETNAREKESRQRGGVGEPAAPVVSQCMEEEAAASLSAREYESALEDEIVTRLHALEEMYTSHCRSEQRSMREKYLDEARLGAPQHVESAVAVPLLSLTLLQAKLAEWKDRYKPTPPLGDQRSAQSAKQPQRAEQATSSS